jgi:predicted O-methyltransferase YrrM
MTIAHTLKTTAWKAMRHTLTHDDVGCLRRLLPPALVPSRAEIDAYINELVESPELLAAINTPESRLFDGGPPSLSARTRLDRRLGMESTGRGRALLFYVTTRILRPANVIETGCFTGWDSAVILQALDRNNHGHLYSIDIPGNTGVHDPLLPHGGLPPDLEPGFVVPQRFRDRWTLTLGDTREHLQPLLQKLPPLDMFIHDSDHSYAHMMWEYTTVLPYMRHSGVIISDDISLNTSFWDFAHAQRARYAIHSSNANVGALRITDRRAA